MHRIWQAATTALALLFVSCNSLPTWDTIVFGPPKPGWKVPDGFRIVGYFPSWSGNPDEIRYEALTHINYAFAMADVTGAYRPIEAEHKLRAVVEKAHARGVKVLVSVAGLDAGGITALAAIATSPVLLPAFVTATEQLLDEYDLDGIDLDWEYPTESTAAGYSTLVTALADSLHARGCIITLAVSSENGKWVTDDAWNAADWLNIMAYDDGWKRTGVAHSTYGFSRKSLDYWLLRGVPPSKAVLGVPFYGRSLVNWRPRTYSQLLREFPEASGNDVAGDYAYTGPDSMRAKVVNQARLRAGGVMIWQLNQDARGPNSLLSLIYDTVKEPVE